VVFLVERERRREAILTQEEEADKRVDWAAGKEPDRRDKPGGSSAARRRLVGGSSAARRRLLSGSSVS
jgi:hypothetical protein